VKRLAIALLLACAASAAELDEPLLAIRASEDMAQDRSVIVEILQIGESGATLLARREVPLVEHRATIPVATNSRLVRVIRSGSAPVTFVRPKDGDELQLPRRHDGGEAIVYFSGKSFLPQRVGDAMVDQRIAIVPLPTGKHRLAPQYIGGMSMHAEDVVVRDGETTYVWPWPVPDTAALNIEIDESVCRATQPIVLRSGDDFVLRSNDQATCTRLIEGLPAATYRVTHEGVDTVKGEASIANNQITPLTLHRERVHVWGVVRTADDAPRPNARLSFNGTAGTRSVVAAADGSFDVTLPEGGEYEIVLHATRFVAVRVGKQSFTEDENHIDIIIPGGALRVTVTGADANDVVQLQIQGPTPASAPVTPDEPSLTLYGLAWGEYTLHARTSTRASAAQHATLSESSPDADVKLTLESVDGDLLVTNAAGAPIEATVNSGRQLEKLGSGRFDLRGIAQGAEITVVAPGYLPACVMRTDLGATMRAVLSPPGANTLTLLIRPPMPVAWGYLKGLPGSTCYLPFAKLPATLTHDGDHSVLTIQGLPAGQYTVHIDQPQTVVVPGPPVAITRRNP